MNKIKKLLSLLLCQIMLTGVLPISALAVETAGEDLVIIAMSDYQNSSLSSGDKKTVPQTIVNAMVSAGVEPELALIGGDYTDGSIGADGDDTSQANLKTELGNLTGILTNAWEDIPCYAIQGNHDYSGFVDGKTLSKDGAYEQDNYIVYLINEDSFPWWQGNYGSGSSTAQDKATVTVTANALGTYLDSLIASGDSRPVIIMTHVPMHWSERYTATAWYYDNIYANILFEVVNEAAKELDILFLFGHNHSSTASGGEYDYEIGGALGYVAAGETMKVPDGVDGTSNYTTETLNFTYMNAGYVGKYAGSTSNCSKLIGDVNDSCPVEEREGIGCRAGKTSFWLTWDGRMLPCGMMVTPVANVLEVGFEAAWEHIRKSAAEIRLPVECANCDHKEVCGVCAAVCYTETGSFGRV